MGADELTLNVVEIVERHYNYDNTFFLAFLGQTILKFSGLNRNICWFDYVHMGTPYFDIDVRKKLTHPLLALYQTTGNLLDTNHRIPMTNLNLNAYIGYMLTHAPEISYYSLHGEKHLIANNHLLGVEPGARILGEFIRQEYLNTNTLTLFNIDAACTTYINNNLQTEIHKYNSLISQQIRKLYYYKELGELQYNYVRNGLESVENFINLANNTEIKLISKPEIFCLIDIKPNIINTYQGLIRDKDYIYNVLHNTSDIRFKSKLINMEKIKKWV